MKTERICEDISTGSHSKEADFFNRLILDLKKQLLGVPHDPVTSIRKMSLRDCA